MKYDIKLKFIFAWYDIWIGFFYDKKKNWLYFFPLPTLGIIIKFKEKYIFPAIQEEKLVVVDFNFVVSSPHSFLSALLASPIKRLGMSAYKKIKIINASPEIRETIDFIFDDNT